MPCRKTLVSLLLICLHSTILAQSLTPAFDVASVKIAEDARIGSALKRSGGRITWITKRTVLVAYAFQLADYRIAGIDPDPEWISVQAETDAAATDDQIHRMFQQLLKERFRLAFHRETRDRPVYSLVIGKGGLKASNAPLPAFLKGMKGPEGKIVGYMKNNHQALIGRKVTMDQLAETLVYQVETSVFNKTGYSGTFDLDLDYASGGPSTADDDVPSIFVALQEQLGLRLEKQMAPVEILVVDHMEKKPSTN